MQPVTKKGDEPAKQSIGELQQRYQTLNEKKITAETELRGANKRMEELKHEALEKYGTDDIAALRQKLQQMKAENEQKRAKYQAELDQIEHNLASVEEKFASVETAPDEEDEQETVPNSEQEQL